MFPILRHVSHRGLKFRQRHTFHQNQEEFSTDSVQKCFACSFLTLLEPVIAVVMRSFYSKRFAISRTDIICVFVAAFGPFGADFCFDPVTDNRSKCRRPKASHFANKTAALTNLLFFPYIIDYFPKRGTNLARFWVINQSINQSVKPHLHSTFHAPLMQHSVLQNYNKSNRNKPPTLTIQTHSNRHD